MTISTIRLIPLLLALFFAVPFTHAQNAKKQGAETQKYPASFMISKADLANLLKLNVHEVVKNKNNRYLDGSIVMASTTNGDMRYMKLKLAYFRKAFLNIQVNGTSSTQVFILSDDKSVFYKGSFEKENVVMIKSTEGEIISE